ncbi:MAG: NAD(P)H-hydrate epimerase, partial [Simkaniaceae bacterium]|nr:NAD(P)H-hydrate epimerase [Simkaniaceae bacterium]
MITSAEMARIEKISIDEGADSGIYMDRAGEGIAEFLDVLIERMECKKEVTLLVGKGNNGGDAFVAGRLLIQSGMKVKAIAPFSSDASSPLCQKHRKLFEKCGGVILDEMTFSGVILDGLLGTGFQGETSGKIKDVIDAANESDCSIVSIDIPSGLDGNTGKVEGSVINAFCTIYLGQPKIGFFIGEGFTHVGHLHRVDFGIEQKYIDAMNSVASLIDEDEIVMYLPEISRVRHKYESG